MMTKVTRRGLAIGFAAIALQSFLGGLKGVSGNASLAGGTFRAATFDITGEASTTYAITLPGGAATLTGTPSGTMTVDTWTSNPAATGTLSGGGTQTISVGGDLNIGASQAQGSYTGTYTVTVDYN